MGSRLPRFDDAALREFAGAAAFERGVAYFDGGRVEILVADKKRIRARVAGTEAYTTELRGTGRNFTGDCTCVAFSEWGFCKHLVATALAVNAMEPAAITALQARP